MDRHPADQHFAAFRRSGDPSALAAVFDLLAQEMLLVAAHLARPGSEPEDLLQATFLAAIESAPRWDEARPLLPWLIGILVNQARHDHRRRRPATGMAEAEVASDQPDPAEVAAARELSEHIVRTLGQLPRPYRQVMTLRWVHGLSAAQIAHSLGTPLATVKTRLRRGLDVLKQALPPALAASALALIRGAALAQVRARVVEHAAAWGSLHAAPTAVGLGTAKVAAAAAAVVAIGVAIGAMASWWRSAPTPAAAPPGAVLGDAADGSPAPLAGNDDPRQPTEVGAGTGPALVVDVHFAADGAPVAGACVGLIPLDLDQPALRERWITADGDGRAQVSDLPPARYRVVAARGGAVEVAIAAGGTARVALPVPPGIDVAGVVVDGGGSPVAGARVWVSQPDRLDEVAPTAAVSDRAGAFTLRAVEPSRAVSALADGYAVSPHVPVAAAQADEGRLRLRLTERAVSLRGCVRDADGRPVAGARVLVGLNFRGIATPGGHDFRDHVPPLWLTTDADGRFASGNVDPRRTPLWCAALGHAVDARNVAIDGDTEVEVTLPRGATLHGEVVDERGVGIAGALVTVTPQRFELGLGLRMAPRWVTAVARTDAGGRFRLGGILAGAVSARAATDDGRSAVATIDLVDGGEGRWRPVLRPQTALRVRVVDPDGDALGGVRLAALRAGRVIGGATTDGDGVAAFADCEPAPHDVQVLGPDDSAFAGALAGVCGALPHAGVAELVVPRTALASGTIAGRLVDAGGAGVGGVVVQLRLDTRGGASATTDGDGCFRAPRLPLGRYDLFARRGDALVLCDRCELSTDGEEVDVRATLAEPGSVTIALTERAQALAASGSAWVVDADGTRCALLSLRGRPHAEMALAPGEYQAMVFDRNLVRETRAFTVRSGSETRVVLDPLPGVVRTIRLRHPAAVRPRWARVLTLCWTWRDGAGGVVRRDRTFWLLDGNAHLDLAMRLLPGPHDLRVEADDGCAAQVTFDVTADAEAPPIVLDLVEPAVSSTRRPDRHR